MEEAERREEGRTERKKATQSQHHTKKRKSALADHAAVGGSHQDALAPTQQWDLWVSQAQGLGLSPWAGVEESLDRQ